MSHNEERIVQCAQGTWGCVGDDAGITQKDLLIASWVKDARMRVAGGRWFLYTKRLSKRQFAQNHSTWARINYAALSQDDCACRCFAVCVRECGFEIGFLGGEKKKADNGLRCVWAMRESVDFGVIE